MSEPGTEFVMAIESVRSLDGSYFEAGYKTNKTWESYNPNTSTSLLRLNSRALCIAIARAFDLQPKFAQVFDLPNTWQIAEWSTKPIFFTIQRNAFDYRGAVAQLAAKQKKAFILLTPTSFYIDSNMNPMLNSCDAEHFDLSTHIVMEPSGVLRARSSAEKLFSASNTKKGQELTEEEARSIYLDLLISNKKEIRKLKAPLLMVFDLYCNKRMSAREIATELRCCKSTIITRIRELEERAHGQKLRTFRNFSSIFDKIEDWLTDSRASNINRESAANGDDPDE